MNKGFIIIGRQNGKMIGLLQRVLESAENYGKAEVDMEIRTKRAIDELAKRCRYSQKVLRGINESLTLGNSKGNKKN
jgi:hypothetical protein